eukprot:augustus_masked-scaffold_3-processed-gene-10.4-mRNA-1 protein AED:0.32 eAED:0.32 QI:0/-1/0/1/-1/1/1/0/149
MKERRSELVRRVREGKSGKKDGNRYLVEYRGKQRSITVYPRGRLAINGDLRAVDLGKLIQEVRVFDAVVLDPSWKLSQGATPTRGVAITYDMLNQEELLKIRFGTLVTNGYVFMWTATGTLAVAMNWIDQEGFEMIEQIVWIKMTEGAS